MSEETYRPQKRAISKEDLMNAPSDGRSPDENQQTLNDMAAMRAMAAAEVGKEMDGPTAEGGVQVSGQIPQFFKNVVAQQRVEKQSGNYEDRPLERKNLKKRELSDSAEMRVVGSTTLEGLIEGISKCGMAYEAIVLPSKGKFYDGENGPADGIIHIRPMTGEEEEILATPRFVKKGNAINMIFNRCMKESYNSEFFLTQDRTYMLIYLRGISYTPEYDVEIKDPDTDQAFATTIDLATLHVDYCPNDFDESSLEDVLPKTQYRFRYRLATGRDEQAVQDYRERRAKSFDLSGKADDTLLWRTAYLIEQIEGLSDKLEIQMLLQKLPIQDVAYLRTVVNEPPFKVDTKVTVTNPYTLNDFEVDLPLEANFFFPRAKRNKKTTQ